MKSIEYIVVDKYLKQQELPSHKQIPAQNYIDWAHIGAREAQRWFSVSEEMPDTADHGISENVIIKLSVYNKKNKNTYECCIEAYYDSDIKTWHFMLPVSDKGLELTPVSWRPVERR